MSRSLVVAALIAAGAIVGACGDDDATADPDPTAPARAPADPPQFVLDALDALDAVEAELGEGQEYFEITANSQFTNVFVAVDDASAVVPYLFVDGELQPPAPVEEGATGNTFVASDVSFDERLILSGVAADLPETSIDALSIYGDGVGAIYVLGATSSVGGLLDIVVGPTGAILSVDPL